MPIRESHFGYWSSPRTFVWIATGAVIGIGNITRLPYLAGEYGGLAWVALYGLALVVLGLPLLVAELLIGRWARQDLVSGTERMARAAGASRVWSLIGWLSLASAITIISYYSVVAGWSLTYTLRAASGMLDGLDLPVSRALFLSLAEDPERSLAWHTIFMVMACVTVAHGLRDGLERAGRYLVTAAFALALGLLLYAVVNGDVAAAFSYMFRFEPERLGWRGALEALHQAFFSLSLGVGAMYAYGAYLPGTMPITRMAVAVIVLDMLFTLAGGTAVYALVLAGGQEPQPGLALIFQTFPLAVQQLGSTVLPGTLFYLLIVTVTMASAIAMMEPVTVFLMERSRTTRVFAATTTALLIWFIGLGSLLSFNVTAEIELWGRTFFGWLEWVTARMFTPLVGLLLCVFAGRIMPMALAEDAWGRTPGLSFRIWRTLLRYPARVGMVIVILYSLGAIDALVELWTPKP